MVVFPDQSGSPLDTAAKSDVSTGGLPVVPWIRSGRAAKLTNNWRAVMPDMTYSKTGKRLCRLSNAAARRYTLRSFGAHAHAVMLRIVCYVRQSGLDKPFLELITAKVSGNINHPYSGALGQDLHSVPWTKKQSTFVFWTGQTIHSGEREQAALERAEALMRRRAVAIATTAEDRVRRYFAHKQHVDLTITVITASEWNRFVVTFGRFILDVREPSRSTRTTQFQSEKQSNRHAHESS